MMKDAAAELLANARAQYPSVDLSPEIFLPFLAKKSDEEIETASARLDVGALYLACACGHGERNAIAELERRHFPKLDGALRHAGVHGAALDEVKQELRVRLLAPAAQRPPRILEYGGRGSLDRWLRAAAVHLAIDLARGTKPGGDDELQHLALPEDDPELAHMKRRYRGELASALRSAIDALEPEARTDLRLYYLEGLQLSDLASLRRITVSAASRRLTAARQRILDETKHTLRRQLGVSRADVESILGLIRSRLELSRSALEDD